MPREYRPPENVYRLPDLFPGARLRRPLNDRRGINKCCIVPVDLLVHSQEGCWKRGRRFTIIHDRPGRCPGACDVPQVITASTERHPSAADRKSTRLNSSHHSTSYAVFCLKKK